MYSLTASNKRGEELALTQTGAFSIVNTDGFDPPDATINTDELAGYDGGTFNSSRLNMRTIALTLAINSPVLDNRLTLYRFFSPKNYVKLTYKTEAREMYAEGYVQTMQVDLYGQKEIAQITVICPNPYLRGIERENVVFSYVEDLFEFPFAIESDGIPFSELVGVTERVINNHGDIPTGAVFRIKARGQVMIPKILCADSGEYLQFALSMDDGDTITVSTEQGNKYATFTHNDIETNCIGDITAGSTFFSLMAGESSIVLDASSGAEYLEAVINFDVLYMGV